MGDDCVHKRDGSRQPFLFDKILGRIKALGKADLKVNYSSVVQKVAARLYDGITTSQIDKLVAEQCASLVTLHYDYGVLAGRIVVSNHHKMTPKTLYAAASRLYNFKDTHGKHRPLLAESLYRLIEAKHLEIERLINYERDYDIDYFGFKTLERAYLMRVNGTIVERPQHMWMRVALCLHGDDFDKVEETYYYMSKKYFTHATPTLFNAGTPRPQLSSCYLLAMEDDSIEGIYGTLTDCAKISKWAGGIGLHIHNIRASGSHIHGTNGVSNGIVPMLRVYNVTARYVDQGGGKRNGSFAIYLEPWHADIYSFLSMKKNHGDEEARARDLFYGLWIPDLFMKRVKDGGQWTLMCPNTCPGLADIYGDDFTALYQEYEKKGLGTKTIEARDLWFKILDSQIETGTPYMLYKDSCNNKSNQKNLGTIRSSNLCTEIIEYSSPTETAVCNLASVALPAFVDVETKMYDYQLLYKVVQIVVQNLNRVIDINFYPTEKTRRSNLLHRPMGIGVQGLADTFALMDIAFESSEARAVNKKIFETIYYAAVEQSNRLASRRNSDMVTLRNAYDKGLWGFTTQDTVCREYVASNSDVLDMLREMNPIHAEIVGGRMETLGSYSSFSGSPASCGQLQFDLWPGSAPTDCRHNWTRLREKVAATGLRNSLLIAPMPTASTAQILGYNEAFEPFTSNLYVRRVSAGEYVLLNKYLFRELSLLGVWSQELKDSIVRNDGSIQHLVELPATLRRKYKTVWEMPMRHILDMARDRAPFVCQGQSMNLWSSDPTYAKLTAMHMYGWELGLKTGMYYLRTKAKAAPQQFTIAPVSKRSVPPSQESCLACGS